MRPPNVWCDSNMGKNVSSSGAAFGQSKACGPRCRSRHHRPELGLVASNLEGRTAARRPLSRSKREGQIGCATGQKLTSEVGVRTAMAQQKSVQNYDFLVRLGHVMVASYIAWGFAATYGGTSTSCSQGPRNRHDRAGSSQHTEHDDEVRWPTVLLAVV